MHVSTLIRQRLDALNMSQTQLADKLGVRQPTVGRWLTREDLPSERHADRLAAWLGIARQELDKFIAEARLDKRSAAERIEALEAEVNYLRHEVKRLNGALRQSEAALRRVLSSD